MTSSGIALFADQRRDRIEAREVALVRGSVSGAGGAAAAVHARRSTFESVLMPPAPALSGCTSSKAP